MTECEQLVRLQKQLDMYKSAYKRKCEFLKLTIARAAAAGVISDSGDWDFEVVGRLRKENTELKHELEQLVNVLASKDYFK